MGARRSSDCGLKIDFVTVLVIGANLSFSIFSEDNTGQDAAATLERIARRRCHAGPTLLQSKGLHVMIRIMTRAVTSTAAAETTKKG
jgi:hypothetical protein